jgi:protein-L-isoaspartate O-methyltransferase
MKLKPYYGSRCRLRGGAAGLAAAVTVMVVVASGLQATAWGRNAPQFSDRLSPYISTPHAVVLKMLELAGVRDDDTVYDLGSGDGRIVIAAAQRFGARAVGVEIRGELAERSSAEIAKLGLQKSARIIHGDMFETDIGPATVVALYQLTAVNKRLRPLLEKNLRRGARVVSCDFQIPGWTPTQVIKATSEAGTEYELFLYVRP